MDEIAKKSSLLLNLHESVNNRIIFSHQGFILIFTFQSIIVTHHRHQIGKRD